MKPLGPAARTLPSAAVESLGALQATAQQQPAGEQPDAERGGQAVIEAGVGQRLGRP
jgi:hypothetical protein